MAALVAGWAVLSPLEQALLALLLVTLMTGLGATLSAENFRAIAKSPKGPLIGLASQYLWMPLIAYGLALALELPPAMAISLIVVGCTPGGTTSNLFTYYARADVALSISMTAISTIAAIVLMPLTLGLYLGSLGSLGALGSLGSEGVAFAVPYRSVIATLALMLVPMAIGMLVRARAPERARLLERVGSLAGLGVLALLIVSGLVRNGHLLLASPPSIVLAAVGLGLIGLGLGYLGARLLGLGPAQRRAVAFETGIQNSPLALGIIFAAFPEAMHQEMMWIPLLYALFVIAVSGAIALGLRRLPVDRQSR